MTALLRHRASRIVAALLLLGTVPSLQWAVRGDERPDRAPGADPRYATQSGSPARTRAEHVRNQGGDHVDSAVEACGGIGLPHLAARYGLKADPQLVARRFAADFEAAYRADAYKGCLEGLVDGG